MKKAAILHVTDVEEEVSPQGVANLISTLRSMDVSTVLVAQSDQEVLRGWMHLTDRGMEQVLLMRVYHNAAMSWFESRNAPAVLRRDPKAFIGATLN